MGSLRVAGKVLAALLVASGATAVSRAQTSTENRIVVDGSTTVGPIAKAFAEYFKTLQPGVDIQVSESGSGNGAKSLINGTCDVADMSRFMKDAEFKAAVDKGVLPVAHVVALDGVAVVVNPSNPIKGLTLEQVRDIYSGKIANWKAVGGPDAAIVKIGRETNSGTYETFEERVMEKEKVAADAESVGSNGAVRQRIGSTPAAIGYIGLGYAEGLKALPINGIEPTPATVSTGKYPVSRPLFMFTNGYPQLGSPLHAFVTLHLTPKGQEMVERAGYVPVTTYAQTTAAIHDNKSGS